jgi:hypothetical protein
VKLNVKQFIEVLGIIAIVVSLIFVGFELRLNTAAVSSESAYQLNLSMDNRYRMMAQDATLAELVTKGYESPNLLTDLEKVQFEGWIRADLNTSEAAWFSYSKGLIEEVDFNGYISSTCDRINSNGGRWFWQNNSDKYASGFVDDIQNWCF